MNTPLLLSAVLMFGNTTGIVIGAHLASTGRILGRRQEHQEPPATTSAAALQGAPAAAVAAVLREHAELAAVLRELSAPAPDAHAVPVAYVRELPGGDH